MEKEKCPRCRSTNTSIYPFESDIEDDDLICEDCGFGT